jgi:hypothetical protein
MVISYDEFMKLLESRIMSDDDGYSKLVETVVKYPARYSGLFRLSNAKSKLVQNVTQSREIKLGDFLEDIVTVYFSKLGYTNLEKNLG